MNAGYLGRTLPMTEEKRTQSIENAYRRTILWTNQHTENIKEMLKLIEFS